ncbi:MAG: hypothetical protein ACRBBN_17945 [Methyloligellaceae bacterium]
MTIGSVVAITFVGAIVGLLTSLLFRADSFNTLIYFIVAILGSLLAGALVPDTMILKPEIIEHLLRAMAGAILLLIVIGIIRKV